MSFNFKVEPQTTDLSACKAYIYKKSHSLSKNSRFMCITGVVVGTSIAVIDISQKVSSIFKELGYGSLHVVGSSFSSNCQITVGLNHIFIATPIAICNLTLVIIISTKTIFDHTLRMAKNPVLFTEQKWLQFDHAEVEKRSEAEKRAELEKIAEAKRVEDERADECKQLSVAAFNLSLKPEERAEAALTLANYHGTGYGVEVNELKQLQLTKLAVSLNSLKAIQQLYSWYAREQKGLKIDEIKMGALVQMAADLGDFPAQKMIYKGQVRKYENPANNEEKRIAANYLSEACRDGRGTAVDHKTSFIYLISAVKLGSKEAMFSLAKLYLHGSRPYQLEINRELAYKWLKHASLLGHVEARKILKSAFYVYENQFAEQMKCKFNEAMSHLTTTATKEDFKKATDILRFCAEREDVSSKLDISPTITLVALLRVFSSEVSRYKKMSPRSEIRFWEDKIEEFTAKRSQINEYKRFVGTFFLNLQQELKAIK